MTEDVQDRVGWRTLRRNASAVLAARLLVPVCNVLLVVTIARIRGAALLGQYTLLVTLFLLLENLKSLGLTTLVVRAVSQDRAAGMAQYRSLVRIGIVGALIGAPAMCLLAAFTASTSSSLLPAAALMSMGLIPSAFALAGDALFLALNRASVSLGITLAENVLRVCISLATVWLWGGGIVALAGAYVVSRLFAALTQKYTIRYRLRLALPHYDPATTREMLRRAPAFVTVFVSPLVLFRMDVVLLGLLAGDYEVGIYGAAARLISLGLIVPDSILTATFVQLSRLAAANEPNFFRRLVERTLEFMTGGLNVTAIAGALFAPLYLTLLYGPKFGAAVPVMQTLIWALPLFAASRTVGDALVARGQQNSVARIVLVTIGASAGLYFLLIKTGSVNGAAWAFLSSAAILCTLTLWKGLQMQVARWGTIWPALLPFGASLAAFQATRAAAPSLGVTVVCMTAAATMIPMSLVEWRFWRNGGLRSADQKIEVHRRALAAQEEVG